MYVSILFTFFSFTNPSSAIPKVDLLIQCPSFFSHGSTDFPATDMLPRQPQKTMHTLMSFRLSNMMHHLQQNKTALQKRRRSPPAMAVLFWMDEIWILSVLLRAVISFPETPWCNFLKLQLCIDFIWRDAESFSSATGILAYGLPVRGWNWHCLSRTTTLWTSWIVHIYNKYVFDYWGRCIM